MPASTVSLPVVQNSTPVSTAHDSNQSTAAGNSFPNDGNTYLYVQNFSGSSKTLTFYADIFGVERTVATVTVASGASGINLFGPFDPVVFNEHGVTDSTKQGHVMLSHNGANSDITFCAFRILRAS